MLVSKVCQLTNFCVSYMFKEETKHSNNFSDLSVIEPAYQLIGKLAEMYQQGGYGLPKNPLK